MKIVLVFFIITLIGNVNAELESKYHHYDDMVDVLINISSRCDATMYSIGKSVRGRDLWVIEFGIRGDIKIPSVKLVGNIHGNEAVGREVALRFAEYLCDTAAADEWILSNTRIAILPSMNPDGFEAMRRTNSHFYDLNRNFPDQFMDKTKIVTTSANRQPEVAAVMRWSIEQRFTLSLSLHSGSLVANYPFDGNREHESGIYSRSPDDEIFRSLALAYSLSHPRMRESKEFTDGITNGAEWYTLYGGMQDWNYLEAQTFDITVEISKVKWPDESELDGYWEENRLSILRYIERVHVGIYGLTDSDIVSVPGLRDIKPLNRNGYYIRLLEPGNNYTLSGIMINKVTQIQIPVVEEGKPPSLIEHNFI